MDKFMLVNLKIELMGGCGLKYELRVGQCGTFIIQSNNYIRCTFHYSIFDRVIISGIPSSDACQINI